VHSTAADISKFLNSFLRPNGVGLKPETAAAMIVNHTPGLNETWGLGWRLDLGAFGGRARRARSALRSDWNGGMGGSGDRHTMRAADDVARGAIAGEVAGTGE